MIVNFLRTLIGIPPTYFTIGTSTTPQWHYGQLLEYSLACMLAILLSLLLIKSFISLIRSFFVKEGGK